MKTSFIYTILFALLMASGVCLKSYAQPAASETAPDAEEIAKIKKAIAADPANIALHEQYLKASGFTKWGSKEDPDFIRQYEDWMKEFPKVAAIPYALGHAFAGRESPKAKPYLLKAVTIDPAFDKAYFDLWIDGERWGDFKASREYLVKAKKAAPSNADYAFYYANGYSDSDPEKYTKLSLEVAANFPNTERGAQALYWLANRTSDTKAKQVYYEQQKKDFPADKFNWTASGMSEYYNLLLEHAPEKAKALADYMVSLKGRSAKTWEKSALMATTLIAAKSELAAGKPVAAAALLDSVAVPRYSSAKEYLLMLKANTNDAAGKTQQAYDQLLTVYAKEPAESIYKALLKYGNKLGKKENDVEKDSWYLRDTASKQAPVFNLETYLTKGKSSLNDYKGKVVLVTYWFPGCGPCRGEFPHFENVVKQFKGKEFVYLGINIVADQDEYVVPFMKSSGYSFIPLKDNEDWTKGPLDNRNAAPVNFLIDQDGKIIYANFRTDHKNEATLTLMIRSLLERKKNA